MEVLKAITVEDLRSPAPWRADGPHLVAIVEII
jgi:hypothetical protein